MIVDQRFSERLLEWFDNHGRKNLPWQQPASPYRVWLSEIMLQQTQVSTVIAYFQRFIDRFPDVPTLAETLSGYDLGLYSGLWAPKGTPASVVKKLHAEVMAALEQPKTKEILTAVSAVPGTLTPQQFSAFLAKDTKEWGEIVRASGVKVE